VFQAVSAFQLSLRSAEVGAAAREEPSASIVAGKLPEPTGMGKPASVPAEEGQGVSRGLNLLLGQFKSV